MKLLSLVCASVLIAAPLSAPAAEICENVNDVSNGWNALASLVRDTQGGGFSEEEVAQLTASVAAMMEGSAALAGLLQGAGNEHQVSLGTTLEGVLSHLESLSGAEEAEYIAASVDQVTDALDAVTDDCDAHHDDAADHDDADHDDGDDEGDADDDGE